MPIFGGIETFMVIQPSSHTEIWHVGWIFPDGTPEVNRLPLQESVRVLVSSGTVTFFGVTPEGNQIELKQVGEGKLGDRKYSGIRQL